LERHHCDKGRRVRTLDPLDPHRIDGKSSAPGADVTGSIDGEGMVRVSIVVHLPTDNSAAMPDREVERRNPRYAVQRSMEASRQSSRPDLTVETFASSDD